MSAFTVGNRHINVMLKAASLSRHPGDGARYYWNDESRYFNGSLHTIGQKLVDENFRSVNYRYTKQVEAEQFKSMALRAEYTPVQIIKACDCYNCQACETPDWQETEAYAIMTALRERAIDMLPGYDEADWNIV